MNVWTRTPCEKGQNVHHNMKVQPQVYGLVCFKLTKKVRNLGMQWK